MDVLEKIALYEYNSKVELPVRPTKPTSGWRPTAEQARTYATAYEAYEVAQNAYVAASGKRRKDQAALYEQLGKDLAEEFGLTGHPKADLLFTKAWDRAHGEGLEQVYHAYNDLSELVL